MKTKYVVLQMGSIEVPIVFAELLKHADVAAQMGGVPISAGFCYIADDQFVCYGESTSLNITSREKDSKLLTRFISGNDYD